MTGSSMEREQFWRDLLARFDDRLRAYVRRARWNEREVEELVWDVWALAAEYEEALAASRDPWPVLRQAAARASARRLRVRRHELVSTRDLLRSVQANGMGRAAGDEEALARWVERALAQLPEQQRVAIDFRYRWRWPYWGVAAAIGTTEATARVHVWRGLEKLRRIAAECPPPGGQEDA